MIAFQADFSYIETKQTARTSVWFIASRFYLITAISLRMAVMRARILIAHLIAFGLILVSSIVISIKSLPARAVKFLGFLGKKMWGTDPNIQSDIMPVKIDSQKEKPFQFKGRENNDKPIKVRCHTYKVEEEC